MKRPQTRVLLTLTIIFAQALTLAGAAPSTPSDEDILVARVYFTDPAGLNYLITHYDATEYADHQAGFVELLLTPSDHNALLAAGYRVEIDQAHTALLNRPQLALPAQASGVPGYPCYRTVEETYAALAQIAVDKPGLATWIDIGDTWEKLTPGGAPGYDLQVLILTNKSKPGPKPVFFLMAAIHAREYATAEQAARYGEYLAAGYGVDPDITWLLDHFEVHILPHANPDGRKLAEAGLLHRKNTNPTHGAGCPNPYIIYHPGIDLNRNSSFQWGTAGAENQPCAQTYPGPDEATEPEVQAIEAYVLTLFPDQRGPDLSDPAPDDVTGVFITLHSYGQFVLLPWGATTANPPNFDDLTTLGRKFGYYNRYRVCQSGSCLYPTSGTTDDWAYGTLGVAAYTFEMGGTFFEDCSSFESTLFPANQPALLYALKAARRPYQAPAGPETITVTVSSGLVIAGQPVTLTAWADDQRFFSNGFGAEPVQPISATRYSVDAPSWVTGTATVPMTAADGAFSHSLETVSAVLDTTGWTAGRHLLFVESQDSAGNWGVPGAVFLTTIPPDWQRYYFPLLWK